MSDNVIEILLKMLGTKDAEGDLKSFGDKAANIGKSMQKVGVGMTAGLTLPLALMAKSFVDTASSVGEAMGAVSSVFGENAKDVEAWATGLASSFGISKKAGLDAIANYGLILQNMGFTGDAAMEMGQDFVELAADMAAFRDVPVEQALNAVRGALTGEFEMMKQFGIVIKATDLEAKALSMGLIEQGGEMDNLARSTAAAALVMEKTSLMQGTVAREGESLAGQTKMMAAEFDNLKAELGEQLIPVILEILPYVKQFLQWIVKLSPKTKKWALIIGAVVAAIGPLLTILGTLMTLIPVIITVIGAIATPIGLVILAIVAIIATLVLLYLAFKNNWFGIRDIVTAVVDWIYTKTLKPWVELVKMLWDKFGEDILATIEKAWKFIRKVWETYTKWVKKYIEGWIKLLSRDFKGAGKIWGSLFEDIFGGIRDKVTSITTNMAKIVEGLWTKFTDAVTKLWGKFGDDIMAIFDNAWAIITTIFKTVAAIILGLFAAFILVLTGDWEAAGEVLKTVFRGAWNNILKIVTDLYPKIIQAVANIATDIYNTIKDWMDDTREAVFDGWEDIKTVISTAISDIWTTINTWAGDMLKKFVSMGSDLRDSIKVAWENIKTAIGDAGPAIIQKAKDIWRNIKDSVININWGSVGRSIITGIADGIRSGAQTIINAASAAAYAALAAAKKLLGIGSPSREFFKVGENMMQGMAAGIQSMAGIPAQASVGAAAGAMSSITNNYYLTARYEYQSPTTLMDDVRMLQMLKDA